MENGGDFHCVGRPDRALIFEVRVSSFEASEPVLDSTDGSGAPCAVDAMRSAQSSSCEIHILAKLKGRNVIIGNLSVEKVENDLNTTNTGKSRLQIHNRKFWNLHKNVSRLSDQPYMKTEC